MGVVQKWSKNVADNFFTFSLIRVIFGEAQNHSDLDFSKVSMEFEIFFFSVGRNLAPEPEFFWVVCFDGG